MSERKSVLLIDIFGLMYKFYFTLPASMTATDGTPTNAVYGLARVILKLLKESRPDYLVPALESIAPTFRKEEFDEYKAHRDKMPDDLREQLPLMEELFEAMGLASARVERYEADDVIGTYARIAAERGLDVEIITGDKDLLQLAGPNVKVLISKKGVTEVDVFTPEEVIREMGVPPERLPDRKGLEGDSSDNIPGVKGIGAKTALPLLQQFGTLENLYDNLDRVEKERIRKLLDDNRETAFLSKRLGTVKVDISVDEDFDTFAFKELPTEKLIEFFKKLNMKSLVKELEEGEGKKQKLEEYEGAGGEYKAVFDAAGVEKFLKAARKKKLLCIDLETSGLDPHTSNIVGFSLAVEPGRAVYIPVGHEVGVESKYPDQLSLEEVLKILEPVLADPKIGKEGHNLKFDLNMLVGAGSRLEGIAFDSMIAAYLASTNRRALKPLAEELLDISLLGYKDIVGTGKKEIPFTQVPIGTATSYACTDVDAVLKLKPPLLKSLEEKELTDVFYKIEMPLVPVLARMEMNGVMLDTNQLEIMSISMKQKEDEIREKIAGLGGMEVNLNSPKQVAELLFDKLELPTRKKRSTDIAVLEQLAGEHPVVPLLIEYRRHSKLRSTYIDALPAMINSKTGRIHTSFNQTITATGRLSSSDPNLQNIPIRTDTGREIRAAFVPPPGRKLLTADYSQIEIRLLAHLSRDPTLTDAFRTGQDIHSRTAAEIFGVDIEKVTKDHRRAAKTINFGIIYGMGAPRLAQSLSITRKEAAAFMKSYFKQYPAVQMLQQETRERVVRDGYVSTLFGRRRYVPEAASANAMQREAGFRAAFNTRMQGTAADIMKLAMILIHEEIEAGKIDAKMILQVHDELVFEVPEKSIKKVGRRVKKLMETAAGPVEILAPLTVDVSAGDNWRDCKAISL